MDDLCNRFYRALIVSGSELPIKQRLVALWKEHLDDICTGSLPRQLRSRFDSIRNAMYSEKPLLDEHPADASVRKMSHREAASHTATVAEIFRELTKISNQAAHAARSTSVSAQTTAEATETIHFGRRLN